MDVWQYIEREKLGLPSIYFAHKREIVRRGGAIVPITSLTPKKDNEVIEEIMVRYRTVGDITCTAPVESVANSVEKIIIETAMKKKNKKKKAQVEQEEEEEEEAGLDEVLIAAHATSNEPISSPK